MKFSPLAIGILAASAMLASASVSQAQSDSAIEKAIEALFERKPEIITQAMQRAQEKQNQERQRLASEAMNKVVPDLKKDASLPSSGPANGVFVASFFDYNCGYCKQFDKQTKQPAMAQVSNMRVVYIHAPVLSEGSDRLAEIAAAAQLQGKFLPVHNWLMSQNGGISTKAAADAKIPELVEATGLDKAKLDKALADGSARKIVDKHAEYTRRANLQGTPLIYANGETIGGAIPLQPFLEILKRQG